MINPFNGFFNGVSKKESVSWAFYDFANSAYVFLIITMLFPPFFKEVIAGTELGEFYWGLVFGISILATGLISPVLGAIADYSGNRKKIFIWLSLIAIVGAGLLYFSDAISFIAASLLFIATNFFYNSALVFYDAFLIHVSSKETIGRISGLGWGLGYIGGIIALVLTYPLYVSGFKENLFLYKLCFPAVALFYFVFALPAFIFIKERGFGKTTHNIISSVRIGIRNVFKTIKSIKSYKHLFWFFVGFYFITDGIVTLLAFIMIYGLDVLLFTMKDAFMVFMVTQVIGFPATLLFGLISDRKGIKKIFLATLIIWIAVCLLLVVAPEKNKFMLYFIATMTGLVIGSSQAAARSWLSKIVPEEKRFEFFGFNSLSSKISATFGPIIFGAIASFTGNMRIAMFSVVFWFLAGFLIFLFVKER